MKEMPIKSNIKNGHIDDVARRYNLRTASWHIAERMLRGFAMVKFIIHNLMMTYEL